MPYEANRSQEIDEAELAEALRHLPRWSGTPASIERTVDLDTEKLAKLIEQAERAAVLMKQPFYVAIDRERGAATFRLPTADNSVTEGDLVLAKRIDELVLRIGTEEVPAPT